MTRMTSSARASYLALAAADVLLAGSHRSAARRARLVTKPLLMPVLATSLAGNAPAPGRRLLRQGALTAQALSWGGDIALLGSRRRSFLAGLASFLAAHAAYVAAFQSVRSFTPAWQRLGPRLAFGAWAAGTPATVLAAGRKDPNLRFPVAVYSTALAAMVATATHLGAGLPATARRKIGVGATIFLVSDVTLALRKFGYDDESPGLDMAVMATYTAAQLLISDGVGAATSAVVPKSSLGVGDPIGL